MIRPVRDRLVVSRVEQESTTPGGIVIPDQAKTKPCRGKVMDVGTGVRRDDGTRVPMEVVAGDVVLFGQYTGVEITLNGEDFVILREEDVLGVVT